MTSDETQRVVEILREHRGRELNVEDIDVVADTQVRDLYAVRIPGEHAGQREAHYLVHPEAHSVEEVAFEQWPPRPPGRG